MDIYFQSEQQIRKTYVGQLAGLWLLLVGLIISPNVNAAATPGVESLELHEELQEHIAHLPVLVAAELKNGSLADQIQYKDRVVIVTFFASWCPPCLDEFKALNSVKSKFGDESVTIVALNVFEAFDDNDAARMVAFLEKTKPTFSVFEGNENTRELFGGVNRIPTLLVFDRAGKQAFNFVHKRGAKKQSLDATELLDAISPLL